VCAVSRSAEVQRLGGCLTHRCARGRSSRVAARSSFWHVDGSFVAWRVAPLSACYAAAPTSLGTRGSKNVRFAPALWSAVITHYSARSRKLTGFALRCATDARDSVFSITAGTAEAGAPRAAGYFWYVWRRRSGWRA